MEALRALHADVEAAERAAASLLAGKRHGGAGVAGAAADAAVAVCLARAAASSATLHGLYATTPSAATAGGGDPLAAFYAALADVRETHRRAGTDGAGVAAESVVPAPGDGVGSSSSDAVVAAAREEAAAALTSWFAPAEVFGRYIDLSTHFESWARLPGVREARAAAAGKTAAASDGMPAAVARADLYVWLTRCAELHVTLPAATKRGRAYRAHVAALADALLAFFCRTHPLVDGGEALRTFIADFLPEAAAADAGAAVPASLRPWLAVAALAEADTAAASLMDLTAFSSVDALLTALGEDGCREQCRVRGLKVGGSPLERAERLWAVRKLAPAEYPRKLLAAAPASASAAAPASKAAHASTASAASPAPATALLVVPSVSEFGEREVVPTVARLGWLAEGAAAARTGALPPALVLTAWCEDVVSRLVEWLAPVISATARRVEKMSARTPEEQAAELTAEEEAALRELAGEEPAAAASGGGGAGVGDDDEDMGDAPIYNPLNVPLDVDGKPIPLWLYKLHGLNIEYNCEICGNVTYRGRRDFDRHFQDWRHAHNMRLLGIPNTKHFHDVVRIADAQALFMKLQAQAGSEGWVADYGEEYEDSAGNVVNRRTFEDLARMGML